MRRCFLPFHHHYLPGNSQHQTIGHHQSWDHLCHLRIKIPRRATNGHLEHLPKLSQPQSLHARPSTFPRLLRNINSKVLALHLLRSEDSKSNIQEQIDKILEVHGLAFLDDSIDQRIILIFEGWKLVVLSSQLNVWNRRSLWHQWRLKVHKYRT